MGGGHNPLTDVNIGIQLTNRKGWHKTPKMRIPEDKKPYFPSSFSRKNNYWLTEFKQIDSQPENWQNIFM